MWQILTFTLLVSAVSAFPPSLRTLENTFADELTLRLPNDTIPLHYELWLSTDIHIPIFEYQGRVKIDIQAIEDTNLITLSQYLINIDEIILQDSTGASIEITDITTDDETYFLTISTAELLTAGSNYVLDITFNSVLREQLAGFYRSSYIRDDSIVVWLATTQFQIHDARSAFPCYDEPKLRATFIVHITHDASLHAISNMPVENVVQLEGNHVQTDFGITPSMPSYLLAFVISDFDYISNEDTLEEGDTLQRVYAQSNQMANTEFGLEAGIRIVKAQEEYFNIDYHLPKLDQIAIPDFQFGAMENWGLFVYTPIALLYNEGVSTSFNKQMVASIVAHEAAHLFFGNLVTPYWWTWIWLNEGFANLYQNFMSDIAYPEMRLREQFIVNNIQTVFPIDSSPTVRPMTQYIERNIIQNFDNIAYGKGGSVLHMFNFAFQEPTFKKGLTLYILNNWEGVATPETLYENVQIAVTEDGTGPVDGTVAEIMDSWTLKPGFPILTVTRNYETGTISLHQERYLRYGSVDDNPTWWIPYNFASSNRRDFENTNPIDWIPEGVSTKEVESTDEINWSSDDWVLFNVRQTSYYRVNYDTQNWLLLANELNNGEYLDIVTTNRAQVISDSMEFARFGFIDYSIPFEIISYLGRETDAIPIITANRELNFLNRILAGQEFYGQFQEFVGSLFQTVFNLLGVEESSDDGHLETSLRATAINWACSMGSQDCLIQAGNKLREYILSDADDKTIAPDIRSSIFCNGLRPTGVEEFVYLFNLMQASEDAVKRNLLIDGLGCIQDEAVLNAYLDAAFSEFSIEHTFLPGERIRIARSVFSNGVLGLEVALSYIENNYLELLESFGTTVPQILSQMAEFIVNDELAERYYNILETLADAISPEIDTSARSTVDQTLSWLSVHSSQIEDWFSNNK